MSAICGIVNQFEPVSLNNLLSMHSKIKHRGDKRKEYVLLDNNEKLHINDSILSENAPFSKVALAYSTNGTYVEEAIAQTAFNESISTYCFLDGILTNLEELINLLQQNSNTLIPRNYAAVIIEAYKKWGTEFPKYLRGDFAIVLLDIRYHKIILVTDHHGKKSLCYALNKNGFAFASEIKSVLKASFLPVEMDVQGMLDNFVFLSPTPPRTCFKNVFLLGAARILEYDMQKHSISSQTYWTIPVGESDYSLNFKDAAIHLGEKIEATIKRQVGNDQHVNTLLSAGVDSTWVASVVDKMNIQQTSYTNVFDGSGNGNDELPQVNEFVKIINLKEQYIHWISEAEVFAHFEEDFQFMEAPYVDWEIAFYSFRYLQDKNVTISLNGIGADRLMGGEHYHKNISDWKKRKSYSWIKGFIPEINNTAKKAKNYFSINNGWKYFVHVQPVVRKYQIEELIYGTEISYNYEQFDHQEDLPFRSDEEALFYYDVFHLPHQFYWRNDLAAMKHGIYPKSVFLDPDLTEHISKIPLEYRYQKGLAKPIAKEAAKKYIPLQNINMPKKGYRLPFEHWKLKENQLDDFLWNKIQLLKKRSIFNEHTINKWWQEYLHNRFTFHKVILLASTEIWMSQYID